MKKSRSYKEIKEVRSRGNSQNCGYLHNTNRNEILRARYKPSRGEDPFRPIELLRVGENKEKLYQNKETKRLYKCDRPHETRRTHANQLANCYAAFHRGKDEALLPFPPKLNGILAEIECNANRMRELRHERICPF